MAITLPRGVLFRDGNKAKIHRKLLLDGHIDLVINASEHCKKGMRQNYLTEEHIEKIIDTCQQRPEEIKR